MPKLDSKLTDTTAKNCAPPRGVTAKGKPVSFEIYWCSTTPGFGVRVTRNGVRAWILERRVDGNTVRRKLGRVTGSGSGAITAEAARILAIRMSGELSKGNDAVADKRKADKEKRRTGITFEVALRQHVGDDSVRDFPMRARSIKDYYGTVSPAGTGPTGRQRRAGELASIANVQLDKLTGARIKSLYTTLKQERGATRATFAMSVLKSVLSYHGVTIPDNPFSRATRKRDRVKLPRAGVRTRTIAPERLHAWWTAAADAENGDYFQTLLLTGLRRGELSGAHVADVDADGGRLVIADTKNHKPHTVYLSRQALEILEARCAGKRAGDLLFEDCLDPRKTLDAIVKASGVEFSAHDLRRTFASIGAGMLPGYVVKKLVNHSDNNDVTSTHYVNLSEPVLREGWQRVADFITSQKPTPAKVTKIRAAVA